MQGYSLSCTCRTSALGSGSGHHSAFGSSLISDLVLVLLLLDILDCGPVLGLVLALIFIRILALVVFMDLPCPGRWFLICFCFSGLDLVLVLAAIPTFFVLF